MNVFAKKMKPLPAPRCPKCGHNAKRAWCKGDVYRYELRTHCSRHEHFHCNCPECGYSWVAPLPAGEEKE